MIIRSSKKVDLVLSLILAAALVLTVEMLLLKQNHEQSLKDAYAHAELNRMIYRIKHHIP